MYVYLVNDIKALLEIDWIGFAIALLALMGAFVGICKLGSEVLAWIGKPVGWAKQRKEDHEMVLKNAQAIKDLAELHKKDTKCVNEHEDKLREDLCAFMIEVRTDIDFLENKAELSALAEKIVFTGAIDAYFDYCYGSLDFRSLRFETEDLPVENFQGNAVVIEDSSQQIFLLSISIQIGHLDCLLILTC